MQTEKSNNTGFRSECPISSALDILGDKWTLLIIRDMAMRQKKTYSDFADSSEGIASNILADRLKRLESMGIISKSKMPGNKKTNIYALTKKGLDLIPVLVSFVLWSDKHLPHIAKEAKQFAKLLRRAPKEMEKGLRKDAKKSGKADGHS